MNNISLKKKQKIIKIKIIKCVDSSFSSLREPYQKWRLVVRSIYVCQPTTTETLYKISSCCYSELEIHQDNTTIVIRATAASLNLNVKLIQDDWKGWLASWSLQNFRSRHCPPVRTIVSSWIQNRRDPGKILIILRGGLGRTPPATASRQLLQKQKLGYWSNNVDPVMLTSPSLWA